MSVHSVSCIYLYVQQADIHTKCTVSCMIQCSCMCASVCVFPCWQSIRLSEVAKSQICPLAWLLLPLCLWGLHPVVDIVLEQHFQLFGGSPCERVNMWMLHIDRRGVLWHCLCVWSNWVVCWLVVSTSLHQTIINQERNMHAFEI